MVRKISAIVLLTILTAGCAQPNNNEFVFLGESNATGEEAAGAANLIVRNANAAGCQGVSVGGYAGTLEVIGQLVYGVPVMVSCPPGVVLQPNGQPQA